MDFRVKNQSNESYLEKNIECLKNLTSLKKVGLPIAIDLNEKQSALVKDVLSNFTKLHSFNLVAVKLMDLEQLLSA